MRGCCLAFFFSFACPKEKKQKKMTPEGNCSAAFRRLYAVNAVRYPASWRWIPAANFCTLI